MMTKCNIYAVFLYCSVFIVYIYGVYLFNGMRCSCLLSNYIEGCAEGNFCYSSTYLDRLLVITRKGSRVVAAMVF